MELKKNKSGFTLLEIIIVVIIVGVLASLALPRFFQMVEFSRSQEALGAMDAVRGALERFYVTKGNSYATATTANIDTGDPLAGQPNVHFAITISGTAAAPSQTYLITATRNTVDGGTSGHTVQLEQTATGITRRGTGAFGGIN